MAKLKVELERNDWQMLLMMAGQGYQELIQRVGAQLNEQMPAAPPPAGNGEDKQAGVQQ
jgi:hypothetical protein